MEQTNNETHPTQKLTFESFEALGLKYNPIRGIIG